MGETGWLVSDFISVCLETRWLGQKTWCLCAEMTLYVIKAHTHHVWVQHTNMVLKILEQIVIDAFQQQQPLLVLDNQEFDPLSLHLLLFFFRRCKMSQVFNC